MRLSLLCLEVLLLLACHVGLGWPQGWSSSSCPQNQCMEEYYRITDLANSSVVCPVLVHARDCLSNVPSTTSCSSFYFRFVIDSQWNRSNCAAISSPSTSSPPSPSTSAPSTSAPSTSTPSTSTPSTSTPSTSTPSTSTPSTSTPSSSMPTIDPSCPILSNSPILDSQAAVTVPLPVPSHECDIPDPTTMEHCSALTFSHVRPFKAYHSGIQTCSLPGAWYLLRHPSLSVEVEGEAVEADSSLTVLTKVNITFPPHPCSPRRAYFADASFPLPSTFADGSTPLNTNNPLQLTVNGNVASILATWLNTTIVLRQYAGYLSVTIQVPGMLAFESEGLCTGCPAHTQNINISTEIVTDRQRCRDASNTVTLNCFLSGGVVNVREFADVDNSSYRDMCVFDALRAGGVQMISLIKAAASDAVALVPIGTVPRPEPVDLSSSLPTRFPILDLDTQPPALTTQATQRVERTTNSQTDRLTDSTTVLPNTVQVIGVSSAPSQSYHLVNLLTVLVTVLIAALLR